MTITMAKKNPKHQQNHPTVCGLNSTSDIAKERIGELEDRAEELPGLHHGAKKNGKHGRVVKRHGGQNEKV